MSSFVKICGTDISRNKPLPFALRGIYGIGISTAMLVCKQNKIDPSKRIEEISVEELQTLRRVLETNFVVEGELRREISKKIKRLKDIKCYRGLRHKHSLPVRGQRTKTNARTRKGKKGNKSVSSRKK